MIAALKSESVFRRFNFCNFFRMFLALEIISRRNC